MSIPTIKYLKRERIYHEALSTIIGGFSSKIVGVALNEPIRKWLEQHGLGDYSYCVSDAIGGAVLYGLGEVFIKDDYLKYLLRFWFNFGVALAVINDYIFFVLGSRTTRATPLRLQRRRATSKAFRAI